MFSFKRSVLVFNLIPVFFLLSCGGISGEIVHKKGVPHTYPGDFVFTPNSYAIVTLRQAEGTGPSTVIRGKTLSGINRFPIRFRIQLDKPLDFSKGFTYSVSAKVLSEGGEKMKMGDLVTEVVNELKPGQTFVRLEVTGLESCEDEGHGGFCI